MKQTLGESTPITLAAAAGVIVVAFWGGLMIGQLTTDVGALKVSNQQLSQITLNHEARLAAVEAKKAQDH